MTILEAAAIAAISLQGNNSLKWSDRRSAATGRRQECELLGLWAMAAVLLLLYLAILSFVP